MAFSFEWQTLPFYDASQDGVSDASVVPVLRIGYLHISAHRGRHFKLNVYQTANENAVDSISTATGGLVGL
jgi:hypothetical protein